MSGLWIAFIPLSVPRHSAHFSSTVWRLDCVWLCSAGDNNYLLAIVLSFANILYTHVHSWLLSTAYWDQDGPSTMTEAPFIQKHITGPIHRSSLLVGLVSALLSRSHESGQKPNHMIRCLSKLWFIYIQDHLRLFVWVLILSCQSHLLSAWNISYCNISPNGISLLGQTLGGIITGGHWELIN